MTRTIVTKLACWPFKTECTDAILIHVLSTVYVHIINCVYDNFNVILCVFLHSSEVKEYSRFLCVFASVSALRKPDRIEFSCIVRFIHMSALLSHIDIF